MFRKLKIKRQGIVSLLFAMALLSSSGHALELNQARADNLVKETAGGYLIAVKPSAEVNALIKKINAGRKAEYQKIAKKRGVSLETVEKLAGDRLAK